MRFRYIYNNCVFNFFSNELLFSVPLARLSDEVSSTVFLRTSEHLTASLLLRLFHIISTEILSLTGHC